MKSQFSDCRGFLLLLSVAVVLDTAACSVWSSSWRDREPSVISLSGGDHGAESGIGRFKRAAAAAADTQAARGNLSVSVSNLQDKNHNEAIVHWSGNKSNVRQHIFRRVAESEMSHSVIVVKSSAKSHAGAWMPAQPLSIH